jgi:hypothetical protein
MLIDDLLSNPMLTEMAEANKSTKVVSDMCGRMSKATKFVLDRQFAMAADEVSNNIAALDKILPLCRLPFRECWFELAQSDRLSFRLALPSEAELGVKRVGFFLSETDQVGSWSAMSFWSWADGVPQSWARLPGLSPSTINLDLGRAAEGFHHAGSFGKAEWCAPETTIQQAINGSTNLCLRRGDRTNWLTGEPAFIVAMLALLNSRNVVEVSAPEDFTRKNKSRIHSGKHPLFGYRLVVIADHHKRRYLSDGDGSSDIRRVRGHFMRGHFKVRKSGVFWWSACQRGNPALGFVHKDYILTQEKLVVMQ